ncbi:MAG TPA: fluoride efflux transporter CrcB [Thermoanaerobaculia bacterium]|nr:fluoride efflux transporter CrcB [Thermoanaerobaculia bacterium]
MTRYLIVGLGGFAGAIARYGLGVWIGSLWRRPFPLGTFLINISGCFLLGALLAFAAERASIGEPWRLLLATGFLGAYTTFSTFEYETFALARGGAAGWAVANVVASVIVGYLAVQMGVAIGRR